MMATLAWAEGTWIGKWPTEQTEAWRKQIFEFRRGSPGLLVGESGQPNTSMRSQKKGFGLTLSKPCHERQLRKDGQTSTVMKRRTLWWKEDGCKEVV